MNEVKEWRKNSEFNLLLRSIIVRKGAGKQKQRVNACSSHCGQQKRELTTVSEKAA
jgi:hypothetical protein